METIMDKYEYEARLRRRLMECSNERLVEAIFDLSPSALMMLKDIVLQHETSVTPNKVPDVRMAA